MYVYYIYTHIYINIYNTEVGGFKQNFQYKVIVIGISDGRFRILKRTVDHINLNIRASRLDAKQKCISSVEIRL